MGYVLAPFRNPLLMVKWENIVVPKRLVIG